MAIKFTQEQIEKMTPIEIWKLVSTKTMWRFPNGYFEGSLGVSRIREIIKYIIEDVKHWSDDEILKKFNVAFMKENRIAGVFNMYYHGCCYELLNTVYPNKYRPWEMSIAPTNYWNEQTIAEATRWLIEDKLKWTKEEMISNITKDYFIDNCLGGMITDKKYVNGSVYRCLVYAYGEDYVNPWELRCTPMSYWNKETCKKPLYWLIGEKGFTKVDLLYLTEEDMSNYGFYSAYTYFSENFVEFLNNAFPGEYKKVLSTIYHVPTQTRRETNYKNNTSGCAGVLYRNDTKKWLVYSFAKGTPKYISQFDNKDEAIKFRIEYEKSLLTEIKEQ